MAPPMNVTDYLLDGKEPGRLAVRFLDHDCTYGELRVAARQVAKYLLETGGRPGDRVILVSEDSLFWVAVYLGSLWAGFICVPLAASISLQDLDYVLETTGARIAFLEARFATRAAEHFERINVITDRESAESPGCTSRLSICEMRPGAGPGQLPLPRAQGDDLAALMFTSGSTGRPRGVMVSHANIVANTDSIIQYLGLTRQDRMMVVLPFHYCFGASLLHTHLRVGGSLVVDQRFRYPEVVLQRMAETECTGFAGVPSHFQILLRSSGLRKKAFPHLRLVQQAGGCLAPSFVSELRRALPGTQVFVMYGQTEATSRLSYLPPELLDTKPGSVGRGIPGVRLRVLNESGKEVCPGEVGEIVAEGANVTRGYWGAPEESAGCFRDGSLHTGDLATVDTDGFVYIVGRTKDFIKCGGERVSCRQLEETLLEFEALLEAAVIGAPDDVLGEAVWAFVVAHEGDCRGSCEWRACREIRERLRGFCKDHLPPQLCPKEVCMLDNLPKNAAGKVLKAALRTI